MLYCVAMDDSKKEIITNLLHSKGFRSQAHTNPAILEFTRQTAGISAEVYYSGLCAFVSRQDNRQRTERGSQFEQFRRAALLSGRSVEVNRRTEKSPER